MLDAKERGENIYTQLRIRLSHPKTGTLESDVVIYGIQRIKTVEQAQEFIQGYTTHIQQHKELYPTDAAKNSEYFAKSDIAQALAFHFTETKTHALWQQAMKNSNV